MVESIRKMDYFVVNVPNKRGEGTKLLQALSNEGVNLVAFTGFPGTSGKAISNVGSRRSFIVFTP